MLTAAHPHATGQGGGDLTGLDHNLQQPEKTGEDRAAGFDNIAQANRHMIREETRPLRLLQT